jgi:hypothetical protein
MMHNVAEEGPACAGELHRVLSDTDSCNVWRKKEEFAQLRKNRVALLERMLYT